MSTLGHAVMFTIGGQTFAMDLNHVKSIEPYKNENSSAEGLVLGYSDIRGEQAVVVDLQNFLYDQPFSVTETTRLLYVETGQVPYAIPFEEAEMINGTNVEKQDLGLAQSKENTFFSSVVLWNDQLVPVIDAFALSDSLNLV
ncbi:hypothetical protein GCM10008967_40970 [Bacillus carboniphilus]|uniref:CheW-like domain-containing protein n=1 Tax=Bacillus carboniphilus TaxID=86663 RepID=A0ABN0WTI0_9BACI